MIPNTVPLGKLGVPDEIAKAVVFLAPMTVVMSRESNLFVDGGFAQV